jgi:hypothetical protein
MKKIILSTFLIFLVFCLPGHSQKCGKVLPGGEGMVLGSGLNQMTLKRVTEQGLLFLIIEHYDRKGNFIREVHLIKPGSRAATEKFTPSGMKSLCDD